MTKDHKRQTPGVRHFRIYSQKNRKMNQTKEKHVAFLDKKKK